MEPQGRGDEHKFRYSQITDKIIIGSDFCKGGVCLLHSEEFKALGVSVELNLSKEENELPPKELEVYSWLPVHDGAAPSVPQLDIGSGIVNDAIEAGKTVYVHCKNGHGRSPSVVAAYLVRFKGYSVADAVKLIEEKRPESHIEEIQKEALRKFADKWSK
jgi:protein-tyrosine phosphatase